MPADLLVALAGGAIGSVATGGGVLALRLSGVPAAVVRHDRRARALDEDLERWVADDHRRLRADLAKASREHSSRGLLYSGAHLAARAEAKTRALQRYRDRRSETERAFADLLAAEGRPHELWRRWKTRGPLRLSAPERVEPVIEEWRGPARVPGMGGDAKPYDPTAQTLEDLLADVRNNPLEPAA